MSSLHDHGYGGYGAHHPGGPASTPGGAYGAAAYAPPREPDDVAERSPHGDAAHEHLYMKRGHFSAWPHVVIAFLMEAALVGCAVGLPAGYAISAVLGRGVFETAALAVGAPVGLAAAYFVFRDRWRCIEAFSSRFCVGLMNISMLFVPIVALVYANVRGLRKLGGT